MENPEYLVEYIPGSAWNERKGVLYRHMECRVCGQLSKCSEETTAVTCHVCVSECLNAQFGGPELLGKTSTGRPRGWRWMAEYVDKDGTVYHKGEEQPALKGSLKPSEIKDSGNRLNKKDKLKIKQEAGSRLFKLKKEYKGLRWKKDKKVFEKHIKYETRILAGKFPRKFNANEYLEKKY
tara:strand:+ start:3090 stop:3629 length:540 start_codon:yes stop_codon:yes gene_type:complete